MADLVLACVFVGLAYGGLAWASIKLPEQLDRARMKKAVNSGVIGGFVAYGFMDLLAQALGGHRPHVLVAVFCGFLVALKVRNDPISARSISSPSVAE